MKEITFAGWCCIFEELYPKFEELGEIQHYFNDKILFEVSIITDQIEQCHELYDSQNTIRHIERSNQLFLF